MVAEECQGSNIEIHHVYNVHCEMGAAFAHSIQFVNKYSLKCVYIITHTLHTHATGMTHPNTHKHPGDRQTHTSPIKGIPWLVTIF